MSITLAVAFALAACSLTLAIAAQVVRRRMQWWEDELQLRVAAKNCALGNLRNAVFTELGPASERIFARADTGPWNTPATCYSNGRLVGYAWADGVIRRADPAERAAHDELQDRIGTQVANVTPREIRRP